MALQAPAKKLTEKEQTALDEEAAKKVPMSRLFMLNKPEWPAVALGALGEHYSYFTRVSSSLRYHL